MNKLQVLAIFIIFILLSCSAPTHQIKHEAPPSENLSVKVDKKLFAAQVLLFKSATYEELKEEMAEMKRSGVNVVIVRVFHNKGDRYHGFASSTKYQSGVYFKSTIAPVVDDVLTRIIEIGHSQGIQVYAWMTTRKMDWKWSDAPKWRDSAYDLKAKTFTHSSGLDLFNQEVQDYITALYREIAASGADGILIQDDLVYRHIEGFGEAARRSYYNTFGFALRPENLYQGIYEGKGKYYVKSYTPLFWKWAEWKNQNITLFLDNLVRETRRVTPHMKIVLNLYYETIINPKNGIAWFAQDLTSLKDIDVDYYAVMAYHRQIMKEKNLSLDAAFEMISDITRKGLAAIGKGDKLLMKVQTIDWDTREAVPDGELIRVFEAIKRGGDVSLAYVQNGNSAPKIFLDKM
ncbi:MAG: family 10 glycosylhydrolase [Nitrospirae bacterium]|nr:family 10 glycosylhydrolase [Nitrospirota bacterium]